VIGQDLTIPVDGSTMDAYLARPEDGSGAHPAVIVLQEIFGVNGEMRRITDLLAGAGYVGLAINFYHRSHPRLEAAYDEEGVKTGLEAARHISRATLRADIDAAVQWLEAQPFVKRGKVATWGFCMGGSVAFLIAAYPGICAAVSFYGGSIARPFPSGEPEALADIDAVHAPILLCFGEEDPGIPREAIDRTAKALDERGKTYTCQVYPGVGHAFFRLGSARAVAQQTHYSDEAIAHAVADSWDSVQVFLRRCFSAKQAQAT
jgi:carboxymethylenebutenolidase